MDLSLPAPALAWQRRAKAFAEEHLFPHEVELEMAGRLPQETLDRLRRAVREHGLNGINHAKVVGGQGCTQLELTLINEELGKATGALWAVVPHPAVPLKHGTSEQIETYLRPSCLMERRACVAVTEPSAGSDPRMIRSRADRRDGRFILNGEKWFVTSGDVADYIIVHANIDGDPDKPTLLLVDKSLPGIRIGREPKFTHTYVFGHPEFLFENVEIGENRVLGEIGGGPRTDQGLVRRGQAADRRQRARRRDPRLRIGERLGERETSIRPRDPRFSGDRIHARRHGGRDHGDEEPRLPRLMGDRQGR